METIVIVFLVSGFIGMITAFSLLEEIYSPVFEGWKHIGIVAFAIVMMGSWWGGLIWLILIHL